MVHQSAETDPAVNLALEEWLLRRSSCDEPVLFLSRNAPAVLIGRNQNPWLECDVREARRPGTQLVRRISGGGTVYHDLGNLNYSFIIARAQYDPDRWVRLVVDALHDLDVAAHLGERQTIWLGDRKVAGSAFMLTGKKALLHGCMLVQVDLARLTKCLTVTPAAVSGSPVRSARAQVMNLTECRPDLSPDVIAERIVARAQNALPAAAPTVLDAVGLGAEKEYHDYLRKFRSWEWTFGRTPEFVHHIDIHAGTARPHAILEWTVRHAEVADVRWDSSGAEPNFVPALRERLRGKRYDGRILAEAVRATQSASSEELESIVGALASAIPT